MATFRVKFLRPDGTCWGVSHGQSLEDVTDLLRVWAPVHDSETVTVQVEV